MNPKHIRCICCPKSGRKLTLKNCKYKNNRIQSGILYEPLGEIEYPIVNFIPRFVPDNNYASSFGMQWNIHSKTQYDAYNKFSISNERFTNETKWRKKLTNKTILEAGCGSGRFTPHALKTNAMVISFDYSNAVEANYKSNGENDNLLIVQANIYEMPFYKNYFDYAYCFGVLQHTPKPKQAFLSIVKYLKRNGEIASVIYIKDLTHYLLSTKYYVRFFTKNIEPNKLYKAVCKYIDFMWPLVRLLRKMPIIGKPIIWRLLIADHSKLLINANDKTLKEWAYLDSFDMLSPQYDFPQTIKTFKSWHYEAGLKQINVHKGYNGIEGRGVKS